MVDQSMAQAQEVLDELGLEIAPGGIVTIGDLQKADRGYVHHSSMPVAVVGYALVSRSLAAGRFPKIRLLDVVAKRPAMDAGEAIAMARLCGVELQPPFWGNAQPFADHLFDVLDRYEMQAFFQRLDEPLRSEQPHYAVRPTAVDWRQDEVIPEAMTAWRKAYKALPAARQMMVATVMWLYRGGEDKTWLSRVPWQWPAADAISVLHAAGCLADWARLVALYPGW